MSTFKFYYNYILAHREYYHCLIIPLDYTVDIDKI